MMPPSREEFEVSRIATFIAMSLGSVAYYALMGGTLDQLVLTITSYGSALGAHWIMNKW
jgi:hypothetical protein